MLRIFKDIFSSSSSLKLNAGRLFHPLGKALPPTTQRGFSSSLSKFFLNEPTKLFTPGPLGVTDRVRQSLLVDFGSRDPAFLKFIEDSRRMVLEINHLNTQNYTSIYVQGPGTFGIQATLTSMLPKNEHHHLLILSNGAYGLRQAQIAQIHGLNYTNISFGDHEQIHLPTVLKYLQENNNEKGKITHLSMIHSQTTSGILNPIEKIVMQAKKVSIQQHNQNLTVLIDAMSSYGAYHIDMEKYGIDYVISSTNKCIQGVPGLAVVIANKESLMRTQNNVRTLSLDLYSQWKNLQDTKQFRFTCPTHVIRAFYEALLELKEEGGVEKRWQRYNKNQLTISKALQKFGFKTYLENDKAKQGVIITTFLMPSNKEFQFKQFYEFLAERKMLIYPGKLTKADSFRIGSIGDLNQKDCEQLMGYIEEFLEKKNLIGKITY